MSERSNINNRIAKNTLFLYIRTFFLLLISLYTSRVILHTLGVEDFGIYTAVAGIVNMITMVTGPLSGAISRFLTFELGTHNELKLQKVINTSFSIIIILCVLVVIILESVGLYFLNTKMIIPDERMVAANWTFHFAILTLLLNISSIPLNAAIIAHEKMSAFAYIGIIDGILKLIISYLIGISPIDNLVFYSSLLVLVSLFNIAIFILYCIYNFEEFKIISLKMDYSIFKEMFGFAGWNLLGGIATICRIQGTNILLNLFGGPIVNTAQGIANQVNSALNSFVLNFSTALNPSIIKSYASSNREQMLSLVFHGSKFTFYLTLLFAIPLFCETEQILNIWLGMIPEHSVLLVRLIIIYLAIESISLPLISALNATGVVKYYQITVSFIVFLNLPVSYVLLKLGSSVEVTGVVSVSLSICALFARIVISKYTFGFPIVSYLKNVIFRSFIVCLVAILVPISLITIFKATFLRLFIVILLSVISSLSVFYILGCTHSEKDIIIQTVKKKLKK